MLAGVVVRGPELRSSPAGIPIARFLLEHRSQQSEAGLAREAVCTLPVIVTGTQLQNGVRTLAAGAQVRVSGFLARANHRRGAFQLVLHAQNLELLASADAAPKP